MPPVEFGFAVSPVLVGLPLVVAVPVPPPPSVLVVVAEPPVLVPVAELPVLVPVADPPVPVPVFVPVPVEEFCVLELVALDDADGGIGTIELPVGAVVAVVLVGDTTVSVVVGDEAEAPVGVEAVPVCELTDVNPKELNSPGAKLNEELTELDAKNDDKMQAAFVQREDAGADRGVVDGDGDADGTVINVVADGVVEGIVTTGVLGVDVDKVTTTAVLSDVDKVTTTTVLGVLEGMIVAGVLAEAGTVTTGVL